MSDDIEFPVEATHILMFARAVGDDNPIYRDAGYAAKTECGGIIAPPTFPRAVSQFDPDYAMRLKPGQKWFGSGKNPTGLDGPAPHRCIFGRGRATDLPLAEGRRHSGDGCLL